MTESIDQPGSFDDQVEEARKLQKQNAVMLRRKSRGNTFLRKSEGKVCLNITTLNFFIIIL